MLPRNNNNNNNNPTNNTLNYNIHNMHRTTPSLSLPMARHFKLPLQSGLPVTTH